MPDNEQRIYFLHGPQGSGKSTRARAILGVPPDRGGDISWHGGVAGLDIYLPDGVRRGVIFEGDPGPEAAKAALDRRSVVVVCSCEPPSRAWLAAVSKGNRRVVFEELRR